MRYRSVPHSTDGHRSQASVSPKQQINCQIRVSSPRVCGGGGWPFRPRSPTRTRLFTSRVGSWRGLRRRYHETRLLPGHYTQKYQGTRMPPEPYTQIDEEDLGGGIRRPVCRKVLISRGIRSPVCHQCLIPWLVLPHLNFNLGKY